jgi:mevalonate kinase
MQQVTVSAPGKLMLTGSFAVVHGRPCVTTAVDQRLSVTIRKNGADVFVLNAPDLGLIKYSKTISDLGKDELPKAVRFIELLYKRFLEKNPQKEGIVVTTSSDFSSSVGFGSSSAVTVAFAKALTTLYGVKLSDHQLFDLCYQAVIDVQGVGSGFDLATAIWGGTLVYETPAKRVEKLDLESLPLVVAYSGSKADTPTLVRMVNADLKKEPARISKIFDQIGELSDQLQAALEAKNWQAAGEALSKHHRAASQLGVSTPILDKLISAAEGAGAFGASLSGAGGGDCILALADQEHRTEVEAALEKAGGKIISVKVNASGVRVEAHQEDQSDYEQSYFQSL